MRLVTKSELLTMPKGTMFRHLLPAVWVSEWRFFEGRCGDNDYFYSEVGPSIGVDLYGKMVVEISHSVSRDGMFDTTEQYIVLDGAERQAFADQILGKPYPAVLKTFDLPT